MSCELPSDRGFRRAFSPSATAYPRPGAQELSPLEARPAHPSLDFKQVSQRSPIFSVRVGIGWRAVGIKREDTMIWFWIGSHAEYDHLLRQL